MFSRLRFYTEITFLDLRRLFWPPVVLHAFIVSGICLPILLLLGLKNGNIAEMRREIETAPTAREIKISVKHDKLPENKVSKLQQDINRDKNLIETIIPVIDQSVFFTKAGKRSKTVTLQATIPGDPIAKTHNVLLPEYKQDDMPCVAVSQKIKMDLDCEIGDEIVLHVERNLEDGSLQTSETKVVVVAITKSDDKNKEANYAPLGFIMDLKRYANGEQVLRFGWVSADLPPRDTYAGYFLFTRKNQPLTERHKKKLAIMNYRVVEIKDKERLTLGGLLNDEAEKELLAYHLHCEGFEDEEWGTEFETPSNIAAAASDIFPSVIQWNKPLDVQIDDKHYKMFGVSLPDRWIVNYRKNTRYEPFTVEDNPYCVLFNNSTVEEKSVTAISGKNKITMSVKQPVPDGVTGGAVPEKEKPAQENRYGKEPDKNKTEEFNFADYLQPPYKELYKGIFRGFYLNPFDIINKDPAQLATKEPATESPVDNTVFVPAKMLAYFYAHKHEAAAVDIKKGTFIVVPNVLSFHAFRAYACSIDVVPEALETIRALHFDPASEAETLIIKLKEQNKSLDLLVLIVGLGVFFFGAVTMCCVLYDSTERKCGTIGILRVMGMPRCGVFYFICLRSALIGLLSVGFTWLAGHGLARLLMSDVGGKVFHSVLRFFGVEMSGSVSIIFGWNDLIIVFLVALCCCCIGSLVPAATASKMDPFDAISEGRFK